MQSVNNNVRQFVFSISYKILCPCTGWSFMPTQCAEEYSSKHLTTVPAFEQKGPERKRKREEQEQGVILEGLTGSPVGLIGCSDGEEVRALVMTHSLNHTYQ